ncbi:unknown protein [Seminavis robusta]|uniref:Uncharacterized protein n=1 Tax=Seminavis robusta TaxID=568900 RepID=A0A9N8H4C3_9STRA|nr:unknown protein [Seminavis robusta]|eukprot:Sro59_g034000.1 n/a (915) ;mRNA; r:6486-9560
MADSHYRRFTVASNLSHLDTLPAMHPTRATLPGNSQSYYADPTTRICATFNEAYTLLEAKHGGYFGPYKVILSGGPCWLGGKKIDPDKRTRAHRYKCSVDSCLWKAQIRAMKYGGEDSVYLIYISHASMHNHHVMKAPPHHTDQFGLPPIAKQLAESYLREQWERSRRSALEVAPNEITKFVVDKTFKEHPIYVHLVDSPTKRYHLANQVTNFLRQVKRNYVKQTIGVDRILDNDALSRVLSMFRLSIPRGYIPRSDYASADQICEALRVAGPESGHMFLFNMSEGEVYERYRRRIVGNNERSLSIFHQRVEQSFFAVSVTTLWQLMIFSCRRNGTKQICADGTGGVSQDLAPTIICGGLSQKYRDDQRQVTSSLRSFSFMKGSEAIHPYLLHLYYLRYICFSLFGTAFTIDYGTSDHSSAFVTAHRHFRLWPEVCDRQWVRNTTRVSDHEQQTISSSQNLAIQHSPPIMHETSRLPLSPVGQSMKKPSNYPTNHNRHVEDGSCPERELSLAHENMTGSQKGRKLSKLCITDHYPSFNTTNRNKNTTLSEVMTNPSLLYQPSNGVTLCYFHVVQHFRQNNSFVGLFKDRNFASQDDPSQKRTTKKKKSLDGSLLNLQSCTVYPRAYHMIQWIHQCRTEQQKTAVTYLVLCDWICRSELKAADLFYRSYCSFPFNCWSYATSNEQMIYPSNCAMESNMHHGIKKGAHFAVRSNISTEGYIIETLPKLFLNCETKCRDPCTLEYPKDVSRLMVAVTAFFDHAVDLVECRLNNEETYWLANTGRMIGVPLTKTRRKNRDMALDAKRRTAPLMLSSDKDFLGSLTYAMLRDTASYLGVLRDCTKNGIITRDSLIEVLVDDLLVDPVAYRTIKNKGTQLVQADDLDDISAASFDVTTAMDQDNDDDGFLSKFELDEYTL